MKRQVTVVLGPWSEHPEARVCVYKTFEIETEDDEQLRCLAVGIENKAGFPGSKDNKTFHSSGTVIDGNEIDNLVGKLLTYVEATYSDSEQRKAHKALVRQAVWDWFKRERINGEKTVEFAHVKEK